jgi:hypothetical protein
LRYVISVEISANSTSALLGAAMLVYAVGGYAYESQLQVRPAEVS